MSVRDSVWRATEFCAALHADNTPRVLILGLGPSGMSLAISLLQAGARVVACQMHPPEIDEAIGQCHCRYLCPTTFDFPAPHWQDRQLPPKSHSSALRLSWGIASVVYAQLESQFVDLASPFERRGQYREANPGRLTSLVIRDEYLEAQIDEIKPVAPQQFDAVVVCGGPGLQQLTIPSASGGCFAAYGFWNNRDPMFLDPKSATGKKVLILGGQDGGIGDFVRLLTGKEDPFDVLKALQISSGFFTQLQNLNKQMWEGFQSGTPVSDHNHFVELQKSMIELINYQWESDSNLRDIVTNKLMIPIKERPFVQLLVGCDHFGLSYFANRVAAQLLARALAHEPASNGGMRPFRVGCHCEAVQAVDEHQCRASPDECAKAPHRVYFSPWKCSSGVGDAVFLEECGGSDPIRPWKNTVDRSIEPKVFDRIVARFGTFSIFEHLPASLVTALQLAKKSTIRQVPPFYLM